ncbi:hypothetical protein KQX54_001320 [Cotesia glomerata]|uniref:Uncharacterized protein n=1 Tax=Cotesia glomerata TaxID=32391 RepID=A0AAV7J4H2_COTGL|nr:hypothetical protein KQX54_001320 [Cotesia glomerata]
MSIINDSEKISSSVTSEIKSPIKNDSPLITYKISTTINNDDKDDGNSSNINPLSPKISTVINPNVSLKSPIHETKNNNLVDDINESLEKSPSGNKENVKPLSSNNICNNFESITSVSSDIKSTNNESIDSIVLTTSSNTTTIVSTSDVVVNSSFDIDTTQQSNNLNSSLSKSNSQQKKCILESTDKQDCNIINLLSESSTEDVILVKNSLIEKIEKTKALPAVSTSTERPTDITDESANKDNTDIPLSVSSPLSLYIKNDKEQNNDEIDSNKSIPLSPTAALESDKKIKINEECNVENDNENEDIESLFYDIPADEWSDDIEVAKSPVEIEIKKVLPEIPEIPEIPKITISKSETNNQQSNIVNDNNDNDKSANLDIDLKNNSDNNQENKRQLQDIDIDCNNDSNETIILTQNDNQTLKLYTENKNKFTKIQESMDINSDEDNDTEIESDLGENNKNVHLLGSNETKKQKQQHINNNENKSDNVSLSSPLLNENKNNSINLSEKNSSPYRKKGNNSDITGELSLSSSSSSSILLANNKKNINIESKHLLRKSLDSAKLIMDNDKAKTSNNTKKKQLNSTIDSRLNLSTNSTEQHNNSNIENNLSISESEIKDNEDKSSIPLILNESNKQNSSSISLNSKQQEGSVYQNDSFSSDNKFHKNYNKINSDSDNNNNNDDDDDDDDEDEDDNNNENEDDDKINNYGDKNNSKTKITAPSVLLNDESSSNDYDSSPSENDNSDMDSDVAREYNFNGDSECEYSDDNVVGDECRDSETEHSDEDDDGQDLADFIDDDGDDDDDEDDDDDKEDTTSSLSDDIDTPIIKDIEENEDDENLYEKEEDEEEKEIETDVDEEENYKDGLSKVQKLLKFDSNSTFNDNYNHKEDDNLLITHNLSSKVLDKSSRKSLNKLSPITKAKSCNSTPINIKLDSQVSKSADTKLEKRKYKKMIEDELNDSKINSVERVKKLKSSVSLSSQSVHLNKSMELLNVVDNDAVVLMKEKLNETLPSIKLVQPNDNDQSLSKKTRSKNYENNKENDLSKDKKNKNLNVKLTTKNTNKFQEKGAKKNKMNKASLLEADNVKGVELKLNKSEKNKTTECNLNLDNNHVDNYHELTDIESKKIIKKKNKEKKDNLLKVKSNSKDTLSVTNCLKRLSDQVIDKLSENQPKKKRKLSAVATEKILPTRKMFDAKHPKPDNMIIETENEFIPLSSNGGTTSFAVVNINKTSKHQTKKSAAAFSFRQRILGRNSRHPISAYLMYQQKLKASSRDKY